MTDPGARPTQPFTPELPNHPRHQGPSAAPDAPPVSPAKSSSPTGRLGNLFRDPLSIVLVLVIVVALVIAGLLAGELYARSRADSIVARVTSCVVRDDAKVSFGALPPFLIQHMSGHYTNIHIETAGNRVRDAVGMKVNLDINDVRLQDTGSANGSIGSLVANISWSSQGIKDTIQGAIPLVGSFVSDVVTNPSDGTIELKGALGSVTAKPGIADNGIALQVLNVTGLGFTLPREAVQPGLDVFTSQLTKDYPLGIHADSVQVTDTGVVSRFSTQNASIPKSSNDSCFNGL